MIVALYARVSSERQARQATIESQLAELRARIAADGYVLSPVHAYVDDGVSGASLVRPGLERLRDHAAERSFDRLYVHAPDRLARKYAWQVLLHEELTRQGIELVFLHGGDARTPEEAMLLQMQGVFAEYERAKIVERTRRGRIHRARAGQVSVLSRAPYGYTYLRKTDVASAAFQVNLPEARAVRDAFRWLVEDQASLRTIARRLTESGAVPRAGGSQWTVVSVHAMLRNPAYAGRAEFGKREAAPRGQRIRPGRGAPEIQPKENSSSRPLPVERRIVIPVPPLVSEEIFAAAQEQFARNRALSQRNARGERYLLQGLLRCGRCGYALCGRASGKRVDGTRVTTEYYRCCAFLQGINCPVPGVRAELLDGHVWDAVRRLLEDPARLVEEWTRRTTADGTVAALRERQRDAQRAVDAIDTAIRRLGDAYEAGVMDLDDFRVRVAGARERRARAQADLNRATAELGSTVELTGIIATFEGFRESMRDGLDGLSWHARRRIIRSVVDRVTLDEESATITYRIPQVGPTSGTPGNADRGEERGGGGPGRSDAGGRGRKAPLCSGRLVHSSAQLGPSKPL